MPAPIVITRRGGGALQVTQRSAPQPSSATCEGCREVATLRIEAVRLRRRADELEAELRQRRSLSQLASRLQTMAQAPSAESTEPPQAAPAPSITEIPISRNARW